MPRRPAHAPLPGGAADELAEILRQRSRQPKADEGRVLIYAAIFPVYYLAHLVKSRGKRTLRGALNFFYDYIITPRASFHSIDEITPWGEAAGLELLDYDPSLGNVHVFIFRRPAMAA